MPSPLVAPVMIIRGMRSVAFVPLAWATAMGLAVAIVPMGARGTTALAQTPARGRVAEASHGPIGKTKAACLTQFGRPESSITSRGKSTVMITWVWRSMSVSCFFRGTATSAKCYSVEYGDVRPDDAALIAALLSANAPPGTMWSDKAYSRRRLADGSPVGLCEWYGPDGRYAYILGGSGLAICDGNEGPRAKAFNEKELPRD